MLDYEFVCILTFISYQGTRSMRNIIAWWFSTRPNLERKTYSTKISQKPKAF